MTSQATGLRVSSAVFGLVSIVHFVRLFTGPEVFIGGHRLGLFPSLVAAIAAGALSLWLSRLVGCGARRPGT